MAETSMESVVLIQLDLADTRTLAVNHGGTIDGLRKLVDWEDVIFIFVFFDILGKFNIEFGITTTERPVSVIGHEIVNLARIGTNGVLVVVKALAVTIAVADYISNIIKNFFKHDFFSLWKGFLKENP
jgi:hypothetical protein